MKRLSVLLAALIVTVGLAATQGYGHNNSAPNFECINCHAGDMVPGLVEIRGIPKHFVPGKTYTFTIFVNSDLKSIGEVAGGFSLEASAGELKVSDRKHTQISDGLLTHTQEGSALRKWTFKWKAPSQKADASINVMAVAANGDYSSENDQVGANSYTIKPAR